MKSITRTLALFTSIALLAGCAVVDVTKTAKGFYNPTNPNDVQILKTVPQQKYIELGTVAVSGFQVSETAKMHNAIRSKAAPLGANAVILTTDGMIPGAYGTVSMWATGVAIRFQ
jgi:hypothetical protein